MAAFKSSKQRKFLVLNKPATARKIAVKWGAKVGGGKLTRGPYAATPPRFYGKGWQ